MNEIVGPSELLARAEEILVQIGANAPLAVGFAIEAVNHGLECSLPEGLAMEGALFSLCAATDDMKEGTSAFLEKRRPRFQAV